jgi:hypothetical protein
MQRYLLVGALVLLFVARAPIVSAQTSDVVPPLQKAPAGRCKTPLPSIAAPVCCLVAIDISIEGKVVKSRSTCSDPAFESPVSACQSEASFVPASRDGKPVPFTAQMRVLLGEQRGDAAGLCEPLFNNPPH